MYKKARYYNATVKRTEPKILLYQGLCSEVARPGRLKYSWWKLVSDGKDGPQNLRGGAGGLRKMTEDARRTMADGCSKVGLRFSEPGLSFYKVGLGSTQGELKVLVRLIQVCDEVGRK